MHSLRTIGIGSKWPHTMKPKRRSMLMLGSVDAFLYKWKIREMGKLGINSNDRLSLPIRVSSYGFYLPILVEHNCR